MRSLERHRDAGAYALGVLDAADRFRFEDHLRQCAVCAARVSELGPAAAALGVYARATPPCVEWLARPAPTVLDQALDRLGVVHRAARRRLWGAVAALGVLLAAAGLGVALLAAGAPEPEPAVVLRGRDAASGVAATLSARERGWGTQVGLDVRDAGGPRVCELVAVGRDGSEQTVASWAVRADGTAVDGGAALQLSDIARFEVRADTGQRLLAVPVPRR